MSILIAALLLTNQVEAPCCRIQVAPEVELRGGEIWMPSTIVARGSDGYFYASPVVQPGAVAVFRPDGTLERQLVHPGEGPGEFRRVDLLVPWAGDSIAVVDGARVVILPRTGERGRSFATAGFVRGMHNLPSGEAITLQAPLFESSSTPLLRIGSDGRVSGELRIRPTDRYPRLAAHHDGSLLIADRTQYRISYYYSDGRFNRAFARNLSWMARLKSEGGRHYQAGYIADAAFDGRLAWILLKRVAPPPVPARTGQGTGDGRVRMLSVAEGSQKTSSFLGVVDMHTGREVAFASAARYYIRGFLGPGRVYSYSENEAGEITVTVFRLGVIGRTE